MGIFKKDPSEKLSRIEIFNLCLSLFNFVAVIIAICLSIWSTKKSESIAEKSGAFDKGELHLSFGGYFINSDIDFDVYYGVDFTDSILHFASLPLEIHNKGKKTVDNVSLLLKYPHIANIAVGDSSIKFEGIFTDPIERKFHSIDPYDQVSYKLNSINPNFSVQTGDIICLQKETIFKDIFPVKTKDNGVINVSTNIGYGYPVRIGLTAKDIVTEQYNFILNYRSENNLDSLFKKIIKEKLDSKGKENIRTAFFIIIPKSERIIGDKKHKMTFMTADATNTLFCQFDTEMKFVAIYNQNGTIQKQISLGQ